MRFDKFITKMRKVQFISPHIVLVYISAYIKYYEHFVTYEDIIGLVSV